MTFASPESLRMPEEIVADLKAHGAEVVETDDLLGQINNADVIYMTRIQKERFPDEDEYAKVAGAYKLQASDLDEAKAEMIIMHPLPRVDEIILQWIQQDTLGTSSKPSMESLREWL